MGENPVRQTCIGLMSVSATVKNVFNLSPTTTVDLLSAIHIGIQPSPTTLALPLMRRAETHPSFP